MAATCTSAEQCEPAVALLRELSEGESELAHVVEIARGELVLVEHLLLETLDYFVCAGVLHLAAVAVRLVVRAEAAPRLSP